ncbi:MAG: hypothetical protein WAK20_13345 [Candidatus Acidiferrum sp.]
MRAKEGKAVLVILNLLGCNIPAFDGVALRTIGTHLPPMNVRVAVRAVLANVCENRLTVALNAFHFLVQATQRVSGFVVIEFGNDTDWTPARGSVAILARDVDGTVGIARGLILLGKGENRCSVREGGRFWTCGC